MDYITIENLEVFAKHGVLKEENQLGQKFIISAKLYYDFTTVAREDDIDMAVNYALICSEIVEYMNNHTFKLIETVADRLACFILKEFKTLKKIEVTVKKPWAPIGLHLDSVMVTVTRQWNEVYLSIGSNMGDRKENLDYVVESLANNEDFRNECTSEYIVTKPYGGVEQEDFLNCVIKTETFLTPYQLLDYAHQLEQDKERVRQIHWGPRTLDVDILLYGDEIMYEENLIIPHPDMANRDFVLEPLAQIAPYYVHPLTRQTVIQMKNTLSRTKE